MHMAKSTIVSLFTVFSAYISSVQCREATSGNRVEEAGVDLGGGGDHIYIYIRVERVNKDIGPLTIGGCCWGKRVYCTCTA